MAQWGKLDQANNSVLWAAQQLKKEANTGNQTALFGNTTADAFTTNQTVGQFGVDSNEITADGGKIAHTGWVLRTEGSGGRAGRVQTEVLVAGGITTDAEDTVLPDYVISITSQPAGNTANTTASETATFTVAGSTVPAGATITYAWTYANGDSIQAGANVGNTTQATLELDSSVETANVDVKVTLSVTGADDAVSSNATLTITT